jgi:succinate dehydrogenase/fumarate reductase cytochrome b subunit
MYGFYILFAGFDKMIELNPNAPKNDTKLSFFSAALGLMLIIHIVMHALVEPMTPSPFFDIAQ